MDLRSLYLGLELDNPFVPSSTPLSRNLDSARQLEDAGASALVMHSLFQEEIEGRDPEAPGSQAGGDLFGGSRGMASREEYLEQFKSLQGALDIPVIPSLNGTSPGEWLEYASELQAAGARAIELNVYYVAADITEPAEAVEQRVLGLVEALLRQVDVPIGVKLSPYFSSLGKLISSLQVKGAAGVALFNRFYQPNVDLETLEVSDALELSTSSDALLAMRWMAILHGRVDITLAATGGIHFAEDALKMLLCGADVTYLGGTLLANGPQQLTHIRDHTVRWLQQRGYESLGEIRGKLSQVNYPDPTAFARGHYLRMLGEYKV